jgi:AcrR family transcriptional regulator
MLSTAAAEPTARPERRGPGSYDRSKSPEERLVEQREQLLLAAARAFARDGLASTSVASILDGTGISRSTFYRHFRDVPDVFVAVEREAAELLYREVAARVLAQADPSNQLRTGVYAFLELLGEHGDLARVLHREARANGANHDEARRRAIERFMDLVRRGLERALELRLITSMPSELTIFTLLAAIEGVGARYLEAHEERRAVEAAPVLLRICFRALA